MMKQLTYLSILILWGCSTLEEQSAPLEGDFYIQDGWLAFSLKQYEEADKHFNTAIETNDERSIYHFLSSIGKGWTYMYNAKTKSDSDLLIYSWSAVEYIPVAENMVILSGNYFDTALSILPELDNNLFETKDLMNLYSGLTLQRAYSAKQQEANGIYWETANSDLSDNIETLYSQSIEYSFNIDTSFVFQYDTNLDYEDFILIRIENYILIGETDSAVFYYKDYGFECNGDNINEDSIIECLCITMNGGSCPFNQE